MRKSLWIGAFLFALSFAAPAFADSTYTIDFTAASGPDATGSFTYDNGVFSNFDITWGGVTFSATSAANAVSPFLTFDGCSSPGLFAYLSENGCGSNSNTWHVVHFLYNLGGVYSFDSGADGSLVFEGPVNFGFLCLSSCLASASASGSFTVTPTEVTTPEPASLLLLGSGLLVFAPVIRRHFRHARR